jgi:hypothetical protein
MQDAGCLVGGEVRSYLFQFLSSPALSHTGLHGHPPIPPHYLLQEWLGLGLAVLVFALSAHAPVTCILLTLQLLQAIPIGVGQVYGCDNPWTGGMILVALFISSPLICLHAAIGSIIGILAGRMEPLLSKEVFEVIFLNSFLLHTANNLDLLSLVEF